MTAILQALAAIVLAAIIVVRVICIVHRITLKTYRHPLLFLGFGYSYVILGAGAIFAGVALCSDRDLNDLALWLMLVGSVGLIAFDRRAVRCLTADDCPLDDKPLNREPYA